MLVLSKHVNILNVIQDRSTSLQCTLFDRSGAVRRYGLYLKLVKKQVDRCNKNTESDTIDMIKRVIGIAIDQFKSVKDMIYKMKSVATCSDEQCADSQLINRCEYGESLANRLDELSKEL